MDLGWFSLRSLDRTGPFLDGSRVPLTTHCRKGRALQTPRNDGVMSSITWLTRVSAKAHLSERHCVVFASEKLESAGEGMAAVGWAKEVAFD